MKKQILKPVEIQKLSTAEQERIISKNDLCSGDVSKFLEFYEIHYELAKGGYGNVFKGYDKRNMCNVAIKVMPLEN